MEKPPYYGGPMTMHDGRKASLNGASLNGASANGRIPAPEGNGALVTPAASSGEPVPAVVIDLTRPGTGVYPSRHGEGGGVTFLPFPED